MNYFEHMAPDREAIQSNKAKEPLGEALRKELEQWLDKNGIVSIRMDTNEHMVSIDIARLPPRIKPVLTLWGSIYVRDEEQYLDSDRSMKPPERVIVIREETT